MIIFIVEDEYWVLQEMHHLLSNYIPEHSVYAFSDGEEALLKMKEISPELMITDITMPGMTGLELIEQALIIDPCIKSIILTVHDEFEYAKRGIQLGVIDYLLKPIKERKLYEVIDSVLPQIEKEKKEQQKTRQWSINQLLFSSEHQVTIDSEIDNEAFLVVYMLYENWQSKNNWSSFSICNEAVNEYLSSPKEERDKTTLLTIDEHRKVMLVPYDNNYYIDLSTKLKSFFELINQNSMVHVSYGVKEAHDDIRTVFDLLHQQLEQHMLFGKATLIAPGKRKNNKDLTDVWLKIGVLELSIRNGEIHKIKDHVKEIIGLVEKQQLTVNELILLIYNMYYAVLYKLTKSTKVIEANEEDFQLIREFSTYHQLQEWLTKVMYHLAEQYAPQKVSPKNLIPKVMEWVEDTSIENITFQAFANEHHVSLGYLSREFKSQIGVTFSEYLTQYRVDKAKEYFKSGIERTSEVGQLVGYSDPKHFRTVFKKVTGQTPREYKSEILSKNFPRQL